jgi:hypothetical protein
MPLGKAPSLGKIAHGEEEIHPTTPQFPDKWREEQDVRRIIHVNPNSHGMVNF